MIYKWFKTYNSHFIALIKAINYIANYIFIEKKAIKAFQHLKQFFVKNWKAP
jgi:hypothetical protein